MLLICRPVSGALSALKRGGQIRIVDIGIPEKAVEKENIRVQIPEEEDIRAYFPTRNPDTHKGTYGHVLIVAGSTGKSGAAGLTALAALRSGCGLVTLALPESCQKVQRDSDSTWV